MVLANSKNEELSVIVYYSLDKEKGTYI